MALNMKRRTFMIEEKFRFESTGEVFEVDQGESYSIKDYLISGSQDFVDTTDESRKKFYGTEVLIRNPENQTFILEIDVDQENFQLENWLANFGQIHVSTIGPTLK